MKVRTRFAPSPTGYLHIGGVRTALFNWLYARRHGGTFVLRIDDTDQVRNVQAALQPILDGFRWLGIDWDEGPEVGGDLGPYFQSQRSDRYRRAVATLLERGVAYRDYATTDELAAERDAAQRAKRNFIYSRRYMAETDAQCRSFEAEGRHGVVRLKMPREGACVVSDLVRGVVEFEWAREQDHVIQRADGSCLYHLASVVDDHEMEISHVIRAEEHLSNTPRQMFIAEGLGIEPPTFAHLPVVAEPGSKNKLSKRKIEKYLKHADFAKLNARGVAIAEAIGRDVTSESFNPVLVGFYASTGFLPDAVVNYLLLLGWSLDDRTEIMSRREMIESFSLDRVNKAAASFDPAKLLAFQERYMGALDVDMRTEHVLPFLVRGGLLPEPVTDEARDRVRRVVAAADDRIKIAGDVLEYATFFQPPDAVEYDEAALTKRLRKPEDAPRLLRAFRDRLGGLDAFDPDTLEHALTDFVESEGIGIGRIIHALRVATTGSAVGFGMYEALAILGKDQVLARVDRALRLAKGPRRGEAVS